MSGRGDKDVYTLNKDFNEQIITYVEEIKKNRNV